MSSHAVPPPAPLISVVVPTHRRPLQLAVCLDALAAQHYDRARFEVIVINDGGDSETERSVEAWASTHDLAVRVLSQQQTGPALARNAGAHVAIGQFLAFTDDDCQPTTDWLSRLEPHLVSRPGAVIGGQTVNALPALRWSTASQLLIDYLYEYYDAASTGTRFFTTNNLAVATEGFRASGGFDGTFPLAAGEDREFCERWQRLGGHLAYAEDAVVRHAHRLTCRRFLKQHFNYGRGADFLHRSRDRHSTRHTTAPSRPRLEPPSFYLNLVLYPYTRRLGLKAVSLSFLMCLSQAAYATGYVYQRVFRTTKPQVR